VTPAAFAVKAGVRNARGKSVRFRLASTYYNRALIRTQQAEYSAAIADYQKYLEFGGALREGDRPAVEETIRELRKELSA
jgi:hypothetical protein